MAELRDLWSQATALSWVFPHWQVFDKELHKNHVGHSPSCLHCGCWPTESLRVLSLFPLLWLDRLDSADTVSAKSTSDFLEQHIVTINLYYWVATRRVMLNKFAACTHYCNIFYSSLPTCVRCPIRCLKLNMYENCYTTVYSNKETTSYFLLRE